MSVGGKDRAMWGDAALPERSVLLHPSEVEDLLAVKRLAQRIEAAGWDLVWLLDADRCRLQACAEAMLAGTAGLRVGVVRPRGVVWSAPGLGWQALRLHGGRRLLGCEGEAVLHSDVARSRGAVGPGAGAEIRDGDDEAATTIAILVEEASRLGCAGAREVVLLHPPAVPRPATVRQRVSRARRVPPAELDEQQRALYQRIISGPRATRTHAFALVGADGALEGPFGLWLLAPQLGRSFDVLGETMRFGLSLPPRWREIAILATASWWGSRFEGYAHARIAREIGIEHETIARIMDLDPAGLGDDDRFVVELVDALLATWGRVDDDLHARAVGRLGDKMLFELVSLVGYYSLLAMALAYFGVEPPESAC